MLLHSPVLDSENDRRRDIRDEKGEGMCVSARGLRFSLRAVQNVRNCTGLGHVYMTRVVFVLSRSTRLSSSIGFDRILNTLQFRIFDFLFFPSSVGLRLGTIPKNYDSGDNCFVEWERRISGLSEAKPTKRSVSFLLLLYGY